VTGDYYFIDKPLVPEINLDWYLGLGGYAGMWIWKDNYRPSGAADGSPDMSVTLGARLPIGLSWQPLDFLEVFMDVAPSLGLWVIPLRFPDWDVHVDVGVRFWI
jgi:hypothetical protein